MSGLGFTFLRRGGQAHPTAGSDYILSESRGDPEVFRILMSKGVSSDGVGITKDDAAKVTTIGTWFSKNATITSFDEFRFFVNVKSLDAYAFYNCTNLTSLPLEHVETIGQQALQGSALYYDVLDLKNLISLGQNAFNTIPIRKLIFRKVTSLPNSNQNIASYGSKDYLEEVTIPGTLANLPLYSFFTYKKLTKVIIEEGVQTLEADSIRGCTSLPSWELPSSITSIAAGVFAYSGSIKFGIIRAVNPPTLANVNAFVDTTAYPIYVPDASVDAYKAANVWSGIASRIKPLSEYQG